MSQQREGVQIKLKQNVGFILNARHSTNSNVPCPLPIKTNRKQNEMHLEYQILIHTSVSTLFFLLSTAKDKADMS